MGRRKKSKAGLGPLGFLCDMAGAAAMGAYASHKIKKDIKKGQGEESIKAANIVLGSSALRGGTRGMVGLGGMVGVSSGIKGYEKQNRPSSGTGDTKPHGASNVNTYETPESAYTPPFEFHHAATPGMWRQYCEDGSKYGLNPADFKNADDYADALERAKRDAYDN